MFFLMVLVLIIITIKYLPFINLDASLGLQEWLKNLQRNLEDSIDNLERKTKEKEKDKDKEK